MNPDFTLIWPLSCPKDGDGGFNLSMQQSRPVYQQA